MAWLAEAHAEQWLHHATRGYNHGMNLPHFAALELAWYATDVGMLLYIFLKQYNFDEDD